MSIAREEIFGPVLSLIGYEDDEDAVRIANDTLYGLSGYISSGDPDRAKAMARRIRTGNVHLNGAPLDQTRLSAATSSRATAANGALTVWRSSSRSRPSWATTPPRLPPPHNEKRDLQVPFFLRLLLRLDDFG